MHEGHCENIYKDSEGYLTFGIGHKIVTSDPEYGQACGTPVDPARVLSVFNADANSHVAEVYRLYPEFDCEPDFVQLVVGDMMFNMGYTRLSGFVNMKAAVLDKDYERAADEMKFTSQGSGVESQWYQQTGRRAIKLVSMMRSESAAHGYTEADINTSDCNKC